MLACSRLLFMHHLLNWVDWSLCSYVYQKAYVEFFVSPEKLESLEQRLQKQSSITYMAINSKGKVSSHSGQTLHLL